MSKEDEIIEMIGEVAVQATQQILDIKQDLETTIAHIFTSEHLRRHDV